MTTSADSLESEALRSDPENWAARIEFLDDLASRGAFARLDEVLREAPVAVETEAQLRRVVEIARGRPDCVPGLRQVIAWFIGANPDSASARLWQARVTLDAGDPDLALVQYRSARRRNPGLSDPGLDALHRSRIAASVVAAAAPSKPADPSLEPAVPETPASPSPETPPLVEPAATSPAAAGGSPAKTAAPKKAALSAAILPPSAAGDHPTLIVTEGGMVHAHEKDPDTRDKIASMVVAVVAHLVLIVGFGWIVVSQAQPEPPQILAGAEVRSEAEHKQKLAVERMEPAPVQMASERMQVVSAFSASAVSIPALNTPLTSFDPIGLGEQFGPSMSFGMGTDGGAVSFFGAKSTSKKVIFVVDFSKSMMSGSRDELMRKELSKSILALPHGVQYQVICFSGPAWFIGQEVKDEPFKVDQFYGNVVTDGSRKHTWYEGWDVRERHSGDAFTSVYHFSGGEANLPRAGYITATRATLQTTVSQIEKTPLVLGTDWRWPLMMAMNMRPDTIYFMTDGEFETGEGVTKKAMIDGLLARNQRNGNARINTVCMMVIKARAELEQLAHGSGGEFTLVESDGTVIRGRDLDKGN